MTTMNRLLLHYFLIILRLGLFPSYFLKVETPKIIGSRALPTISWIALPDTHTMI